jgi:hypothetical protein
LTWRDKAQEVISHVVADNPDADYGELKAALKAAYPFGERKYHPYKVWCEEQRKVLRAHSDAPNEDMPLLKWSEEVN